MSTGVVSDSIMGACHVVAKFPAIGVALCLVAAGSYTNVLPTGFLTGKATASAQCGGDKQVLIDTRRFGDAVNVGQCLNVYHSIGREELRLRCAKDGAKKEKICSQF